jgi:aminoglycoside phosphotransferase (APT) family kinase protein
MTDQGPVVSDTPGLDLGVFAEFFGGVCPGAMSGPLTASVIAGGRSNLTYWVTDGSTSWVVRRPPLGHVLATAHDMGREFKILSALKDSIYELMAMLEANLPPAQAPAIVHGDYRIDNVIINTHDEVAAIVDWEMSTLGDPLADLGLLLVYNRLAAISSALGDASTAPGYLTEAEGIASYAAVTSRDLLHLPFYIALGSFKLAVILEGIHYRFSQGQTVGAGFDLIGDVVAPVIQSGIAELR